MQLQQESTPVTGEDVKLSYMKLSEEEEKKLGRWFGRGLRIRTRREELGLTPEALGKKVGVSRISIMKWESDDHMEIKGGNVQALEDALEVPRGWVLEGDEHFHNVRAVRRNVRPNERLGENIYQSDGHVLVGSGSLSEMVFVPAVRGAHLSAGTGEYVYEADEEVNAVAFRQDWMASKGLRPERCKVWRVRGDSMEPRYSNGDSLLLDMSDRTPRHGKNFALVGEEGIRVKQLRAMPGGGWEMYSLNPDKSRYPTEPIVNDNYAIIGRVRGRSGDED